MASDPRPAFFARVWLALVCLVRVIYDVDFAAQVMAVRTGAALPPATPRIPTVELPPVEQPKPLPPSPPAAPPPAPVAAPAPVKAEPKVEAKVEAPAADSQALHLLALLQREGRLLDFCEESLEGFSDASIGAAARTVHAGCKKALAQALVLEPVRSEAEGAQIELPRGFDPAAVRLTGNVVGNPPFKGVLRHHGWRARQVKLGPPPQALPPEILAPAEVELP
jgi:hypothetical protein